MIQLAPSSDVKSIVSLDAHLESIAESDIHLFRVVSNGHPRLSPGDILCLDHPDFNTLNDKELLVIEFHGKIILRQKRYVAAIIRRAGLYAVGSERRASIKCVGRVIGWLHS